MPTYYKVLRNRKSCHDGDHSWEPGVTYEVDEVIPCKSGFHACRLQDLASWITWDMEVWEIELGEVTTTYNKVVGRTAKITKRLGSFTMEKQVEFAKWCANEAADDADARAYAAYAAAAATYDAAAAYAAADAAAAATYDAAAAAVAAADAAADYAATYAAVAAADAAAAAREAQGRKILELLDSRVSA